LASDVHLQWSARGIDKIQSQLSDNGDDQNTATHIREQEAENFKALIHEIRRCITEAAIKMRQQSQRISNRCLDKP
jgi:chloramphenicol O-acetyltransferase